MSIRSGASKSKGLQRGAWLAAMVVVTGPALAQDAGKTVYRCPGPPVLYTDALTAQQAAERGCRPIEGAPLTIVQTQPRPAAPASAPAAAPAARSAPGARVDPGVQRERDSDARRILNEELQREQTALAALKRDYNDGQPERQGNERNYQRYLDRVAEMKAAISRKEADIAALQRELGKLGP